MRVAILESVGVGIGVAVASRLSEMTFVRACSSCGDTAHDLFGMTVAGVTAALLFLLWRIQYAKRRALTRERQDAVQHIHHHIRNSLQIITYRSNDPIIREQIDRILTEIEIALPRRKQKRQQPASTIPNAETKQRSQ